MSRAEFMGILAYLSAGAGKEMAAETADVYFDLLQDLPAGAVQFAARRALLESAYPVIPPVGTIRKLATSALEGPDQISAQEAWGLLRRAITTFGYNHEEQALRSLPPLVARAADHLGWQDICASTETEILRSQFFRTFDAVVGRSQREVLMPAAMREALAGIGEMPKQLELYRGHDHRSAKQILGRLYEPPMDN